MPRLQGIRRRTIRNRLKPITIFLAPAHLCLCPRGSLCSPHRGGAPPAEEEEIEEEPAPEEVPAAEVEPEPNVIPEEPEVESEPEVTPEEPEVEPEPEAVPPPPADDCNETNDLLYAVDKGSNGGHIPIRPLAGPFELLGIPDCGMFSGTLMSMAVATMAGLCSLLKVNTLTRRPANLHCVETDMVVSSFGKFGMGYATLHGNTWQDELFIANPKHPRPNLTPTLLKLTLGSLPGQSELTGSSRGELFGDSFFPPRHRHKSWSSTVLRPAQASP